MNQFQSRKSDTRFYKPIRNNRKAVYRRYIMNFSMAIQILSFIVGHK